MNKNCKPCNYSTKSNYNFNRHLETDKHKKIVQSIKPLTKESKIVCNICDKEFNKKNSNYYKHINNCVKEYHLESFNVNSSINNNNINPNPNPNPNPNHPVNQNMVQNIPYNPYHYYQPFPISYYPGQMFNSQSPQLSNDVNLENRLENRLENKNNNDLLSELVLENHLLKTEMKYKDIIANMTKEKELALQKLESQQEIIKIMQNKTVPHVAFNQLNQIGINNNHINITNHNGKIPNKKDKLNLYFNNTIDFDTFIEKYKQDSRYQLTFEESRTLLENAEHSGINSYGHGLYTYLKKKCLQMTESPNNTNNTNTTDEIIMPFVNTDSNLRSHYEMTKEGWTRITSDDKIKKLVVISNDHIYTHHKKFIPLTSRQKQSVTNILLRKSDFKMAELNFIEKLKQIKNMDVMGELDNIKDLQMANNYLTYNNEQLEESSNNDSSESD